MSINCFEEAPKPIFDFLMYMSTVKNKSQNTVNEYYLDLRTFFRYLKKARNLVAVDVEFSDIICDHIL